MGGSLLERFKTPPACVAPVSCETCSSVSVERNRVAEDLFPLPPGVAIAGCGFEITGLDGVLVCGTRRRHPADADVEPFPRCGHIGIAGPSPRHVPKGVAHHPV